MIKKYITLLTLVLCFMFSSLLAVADHEFDQCNSSDAVCVGKVLLDKLDHVGDPSTNLVIEFYYDDYCRNSLLMTVTFTDDSHKNEAQCKRLSKLVDKDVWGVKNKGGQCVNITDTDFLHACLEFI